jgi:hypothetical protein
LSETYFGLDFSDVGIILMDTKKKKVGLRGMSIERGVLRYTLI